MKPVFHLNASSTLRRKTLTHVLPFGWCELCGVISFISFIDRYFQARKLHLHNLFAKSYEDIQQIPVQGAKMKMSEYVCAAKVINNFGTIIMN